MEILEKHFEELKTVVSEKAFENIEILNSTISRTAENFNKTQVNT